MTAEVSPIFPTGDQADETVRHTIDALIRGRGLTRDEAANLAGIDRATLYRRLSGKGSRQAFKAGEVAALARVLGVSVANIYDGLGGVFTPPPNPDGTTPGRPDIAGTHRYSAVLARLRNQPPLAPVTQLRPSRVPQQRPAPERAA